MKELAALLINNKITISSCESFTVGRFVAELGKFPGISISLKGGLITYQTKIKEDVLHIQHEDIQTYGVVSENIAKQMCQKGQQIFTSDICVSFTGNAGPSPLEGKPVGLIYIGIAYYDTIEVFEYLLHGDREQIQIQAIDLVCEKIIRKIKKYEQ